MHRFARRAARLLVLAALLALATGLAVGAAAPGRAEASSTQFSILQDDAAFLDGRYGDPTPWLKQTKALGVNVIRVTVVWSNIAPKPESRTKPAGFFPGFPDSPGYRWAQLDRLMALARASGLQVLLNPTGWIPYWASSQPSRCRTGHRCTWRPKASEFGQFVRALAVRYRGQIRFWSLWNEPNLSSWLSPQTERSSAGTINSAGRMYRSLWLAGWKAIAKYDPGRRGAVLFGETAPIRNPIGFLNAALCLDARGHSFKGRKRRLQGCSGHVARLPIGGWAHHPYNQAGAGSPRSTAGAGAIPVAYLPRLHRLVRNAERARRVARGKGLYMTEYGFQTRPPDRFGLRPAVQAQVLNESDRLFAADPSVKSVAQYELIDDANVSGVFNTGLRFISFRAKPAYTAYRLPIVVSRTRSASVVEVWGWARAARGSTRVSIYAARGSRFTLVRTARTNSHGQFRVRIRRGSASRLHWKLRWRSPGGTLFGSRTTTAVAPLVYNQG